MAFKVSVTGVDSTQKYLDVTADNIANAASIGFKKSRTEFGNIYSTMVYQEQPLSTGQGSRALDVAQQFQQGTLKATSSELDISIQGDGFFTTTRQLDSQKYQYTRAGAFKLDDENYIRNSMGDYLRAFSVDDAGNTTTLSMEASTPVQIPLTSGEPKATENIMFSLNFPVLTDAEDSREISQFDPTDSDTYNASTSSTFYDSAGSSHTLKVYFLKPGREMDLVVPEGYPPKKGMVDCSNVLDPGGPLDGKIAWAAFYEVDGIPIQPMNAQGTDVKGSKYKAQNIDDRALDSFGNAPATSISIDNTNTETGKIYPGKFKTTSEPPNVPDNLTDADGNPTPIDELHIIDGDKSNQDRPHDYWRCEFIYMGRGDEMYEPTEPVVLQPLGFVDEQAGATEKVSAATESIMKMDIGAYTPPRTGEKGTLTVDIKMANQTFSIAANLNENDKTPEDVATKLQASLTAVIPSQTMVAEGLVVQIDPDSADVSVKYNPVVQNANAGTAGTFSDVVMGYACTDVGTPQIKPKTSISTSTISSYEAPKNTQQNTGWFRVTKDGVSKDAVVTITATQSTSKDFLDLLQATFNAEKQNNPGSPFDSLSMTITNNSTFELSSIDPNLSELDIQMGFSAIGGGSVDDLQMKLNTTYMDLTTSLLVTDGNTTGGGVQPLVTMIPVDEGTNLSFLYEDSNGTPTTFEVVPDYTDAGTSPAGLPPGPGNVLESTMAPMASSNAVVVGNEDLGINALYGSADPLQTLTITYEDNTMYDANFEVLDMDEDGFPLGRLVSVSVLNDGLISAYYSNDQTQPLGRVALASFNNEQGLMKAGNSSWIETIASGEPIIGEARTGSFGDINSSSLELSNVDLSNQMVDLIVAQRNYQANSKAIEVDNTANNAILGIR